MQQQTPEAFNTYRLPTDVFPVSVVRKNVQSVLSSCLANKEYKDIPDVPELIKDTTNKIKIEIIKNISQRFKFAVQLTISENLGQALYTGAMCLWDHEHDNYVNVTYETSSFTATCVVFGCLLE